MTGRKGMPQRLSKQQTNTILAMSLAGDRNTEIAAKLGISVATVSRYRKQLGVPALPTPRPLTEREIETIHALADDGCSVTEIARTIGRSHTAVRRVRPDAVWTPTQIGRHAIICRRTS